MTWLETAAAFGTAMACGFLIGAEREQGGGLLAAGARTFPLIALAGALGGALGWPVLLVLGAGLAALVAIAYWRSASLDDDDGGGIGLSSEVAALVAFGLGALSTTDALPQLDLRGRLLLVASLATVTLALLGFKDLLHRWIARISREEIYAATKLLLLVVVVLPLLPDEGLGPYQALNPRKLGLLVVLISGIGLAGYVAMRALGARRGLGLTGMLGGLVSSTAVTLTFAGRAREVPSLVRPCAIAIVLACATMFPRMLLELFVVSGPLGERALVPLGSSAVFGFVGGGVLMFGTGQDARSEASGDEVDVDNPFSVLSALKFTALFAVVLVVANFAQDRFGSSGSYLAAVASGLTDVDAITMSLAQMHDAGTLDADTALGATGLAAATNTLVKVGLAFSLGGKKLGIMVAAILLPALGAGALAFFMT